MPERGRYGGQGQKNAPKKLTGSPPTLTTFSDLKKYSFENGVGRLLILNLVWEGLFRSILASFRFGLDLRKLFFSTFFYFLRLEKIISCFGKTFFNFFFSSRRRHTRSCLVSWARRCV